MSGFAWSMLRTQVATELLRGTDVGCKASRRCYYAQTPLWWIEAALQKKEQRHTELEIELIRDTILSREEGCRIENDLTSSPVAQGPALVSAGQLDI